MLEVQNTSLESNLDASEVCPWDLAVNKELLLLIKLWDRSRLKASTRLEQQIKVPSLCVCPGTLHSIVQHYFVAPQGSLVEKKKKKLSVVFEITSIGLEIAGRWPCKVDQRVDRPCHIVLDEDPALKCPETAGGQVLAHFSMTFFFSDSVCSPKQKSRLWAFRENEATWGYIMFWLVSALTFLTRMSTVL